MKINFIPMLSSIYRLTSDVQLFYIYGQSNAAFYRPIAGQSHLFYTVAYSRLNRSFSDVSHKRSFHIMRYTEEYRATLNSFIYLKLQLQQLIDSSFLLLARYVPNVAKEEYMRSV